MAFNQNWLTNSTAESFGFVPNNSGQGWSFLGRKNMPSALRQDRTIKGAAKILRGGALSAFPLIITAHSIYSGWKEGGFSGAVQGGTESVATNIAWNLGTKMITSTALGPLAAIAAVGIGTYAAMEKGIAYNKKMKDLEMGAANISATQSMSAHTLRQRAFNAMRNTHINGRTAMGNEAILFHTNY